MNMLSLFPAIPLLMMLGLWLSKSTRQIRAVMVAGSSLLLLLAAVLVVRYLGLREAGETAAMLFTASHVWYAPLDIHYAVGVDGISVAMLLLSAVIVFTGTFASWRMQTQIKEYFLWFCLLSVGVFGFFISVDLFTMFMFYEVALIPMYLLIGVWGSGRKEYAAMKLTLMLMGGSALLLIGILGIYFGAGATTMNILEIAQLHSIPLAQQYVWFPLVFVGFGVLGALFPFHTWSPDGHASAPTAVSMLHAGVLMKLGGYGCFRVAMYLMPEAAHELSWIFIVLTTISVVYGALAACVQTDLKYINAYSSVSHCGLVRYLGLREAGETAAMLFTASHVWYAPLDIHYAVGVDGISVAMLLLSAVIVFTGTFASWRMQTQIKEYFLWFCLLSVGVFGFFISVDLFTMFMFYEVALIPMYLLIGVWGSGRKEYAAMKLTLMLMGGSALLLIGILGIYFGAGATTMNILEIAQLHSIPLAQQYVWFPLVFVGFGVLGALFPFHTWSPDGHASAPTAVSMLHAGVLMKLGGYGCFRVAMYLMPEAAHELSWIFIVLTTISVVYGALAACVQTDLKYINAYSSVSHCGLVLFAILMMNTTAGTGAILQMLSHGLMTALFFALIGMIYGRTHTRDIRELSGLMKVMPFLAVGYVIAGLANLGLPGLSGFVAEMTIFNGAFMNDDTFHRVVTIIACTSIVITAVYILRVVGKIIYGTCTDEHHLKLTDATRDERLSVVCLVAAIAGMGLAPLWVSDMIRESVTGIIAQLMS